jgi:hypothetical protein
MKTSNLITDANELLLTTARTAYTSYEQANNKAVNFIVPLALIAYSLSVKPRSKKPTTENPVSSDMFRDRYVVNGLGCSSDHYAREITAIVLNGKIQALIDSKTTDSSLVKKCTTSPFHLHSLRDFNEYKKKDVGPKVQKSNEDLATMSKGDLVKHMIDKAAKIEGDVLDNRIKILSCELEMLIARRDGLKTVVNPESKQENVGNLNQTTKRTSKPKFVDQHIAA